MFMRNVVHDLFFLEKADFGLEKADFVLEKADFVLQNL